MKNLDTKKFKEMRLALLEEKAALVTRLQEINDALNDGEDSSESAPAPKRRGRKPGVAVAVAVSPKPRGARRGKRAKNEMSLREAILKVTADRLLTKEEILEAITKLGYSFTAKNPINSINTVVYSKGFQNQSGKFGPK